MEIFKFEPLLKQTIWGGNKIAKLKNMVDAPQGIGESWEISGVDGSETVVAEGRYKGLPLNRLVEEMKSDLVGRHLYERYGNEFPLLIKLIDAQNDLSIQVHPNDEIAQKRGKHQGKTEMWYALPCEPEARLYNGLKNPIDAETFSRMVENKTITEALARYSVKEGDVFFIPAGRIHAIGAGCFVAEIQQTSDVTYRIYDFDRLDINGQPRQLHTEEAAECIDYHILDDYRTHYTAETDKSTNIVSCPYFVTDIVKVKSAADLDYSDTDSFVILMAVSGEGKLMLPDGTSTTLSVGQTVLLPATTKEARIEGNITLLQVTA